MTLFSLGAERDASWEFVLCLCLYLSSVGQPQPVTCAYFSATKCHAHDATDLLRIFLKGELVLFCFDPGLSVLTCC